MAIDGPVMWPHTVEFTHVCIGCGFEASAPVKDEPHGECRALNDAFTVLRRHMIEAHGAPEMWPSVSQEQVA